MTIGKKLLASAGGILGMALLMGGNSEFAVESLNGELKHAVNNTARRQYLAGEIGTATAEMEALERGLALSSILQQTGQVNSYSQRFEGESSHLKESLGEFKSLLDANESPDAVDSMRRKLASVLDA